MAKQPVTLMIIVPSGKVATRAETTPFKPYRASVPSAPPAASRTSLSMSAVCPKHLTNSTKKGMDAGMTWLLALGLLAAPKIEFERTVYEFGKTSLVDSVSGTFTFRNTGDEVLLLKEPKTSCGCTVAKLQTDALKPGEKSALEFTLAVGQRAQEFHKEIRVASNDPTNPVVVLGLRAEVVPAFEASPAAVA